MRHAFRNSKLSLHGSYTRGLIKIVALGIVISLGLNLFTVMPVYAGPIKDIEIIPTDDRAGASSDYGIVFKPKTEEATAVSIDFSAFGTTETEYVTYFRSFDFLQIITL